MRRSGVGSHVSGPPRADDGAIRRGPGSGPRVERSLDSFSRFERPLGHGGPSGSLRAGRGTVGGGSGGGPKAGGPPTGHSHTPQHGFGRVGTRQLRAGSG